MRPKDYYGQSSIQEDAKRVFTLMPTTFEKQYKKYIKEPIETIKLENGKVTCKSYLDIEPGIDKVDGVWEGIQKAGVIIANITDFKPNVMLELGVALMKKSRVILIAEKSLESEANLPFNISTLGVEFYEPDKLDEFSDRLKNQVEKWITPEEPKIRDPRVIKLMNDVLGLRREEKYDLALLSFESMDRIEPANWYIYKEWGITLKKSGDYDNSYKKLEKALGFTKSDKNKAEIYVELGIVSRENNMEHQALDAFEKAENLDRDNADLYEKWAFLYYQIGKYNEAMNKMMQAIKLNATNKDYRWKFEFYSKKFLEPGFRMGLGKFLAMKRDEELKNKKITYQKTKPPHTKPDSQNISSPPPANDPGIFERFLKRHRVKEEVEGEIIHVAPNWGIYVRLDLNITGLIWSKYLPNNFDANDRFKVGNKIKVKLQFIKYDTNQIDLALAD